tara:strand:+ start:1044 stop:1169 length:126 start_codon:yes stop_codon:yes gene_type:complete
MQKKNRRRDVMMELERLYLKLEDCLIELEGIINLEKRGDTK